MLKALYVADCPRCGVQKSTFTIGEAWPVGSKDYREFYEFFLICRSCSRGSLALITENEANQPAPSQFADIYITRAFPLKEWLFTVPGQRSCPEYAPEEVERLFNEGSKCFAIGCFDAAGTMFRKVLDVATRARVPSAPGEGDKADPSFISWKEYKDLGLRIPWLLDRGLLPQGLRELASCVHQDGNDAAHAAEGLGRDEAADLQDFTVLILEDLYTYPGRVAENQRRREERRGG
jgi:hypothetical protein